ncbi:restriction endonuclease [Pseudoclavibacter sp. CFCC 14310]|nr:restriction endonuclease [Pseudoclavibacter sp. CFCC 14310]
MTPRVAPKRAPLSLGEHNPDVLTCIANLSNDEVFTPPTFANEMLDSLEQPWADAHDGASIWADPDVTFLDPFTKSGVFLREITSRLVAGLAGKIPDLQQRVDHVLTKQVFGIGITELTALLARRSVYCSKDATGRHSIVKSFERDWGNIWFERTEHTWEHRKRVRQANPLTGDDEVVEQIGTGRCRYCGAAEGEYSRDDDLETHAYAFIHTDDPKRRLAEIFGADMHFDVIIGNPPYQLSDGGFGTSAAPIYQEFIEQAQVLDPHFLTMVVPARWYSGGKGLATFRSKMLGDRQVVELHDFPDSRDCFPDVDVAGGICYFLWERGVDRDCEVVTHLGTLQTAITRPLLVAGSNIFIRRNEALSILRKIASKDGIPSQPDSVALCPEKQFQRRVSSRKPYGLATNFRGKGEPSADNDVRVIRSGGVDWLAIKQITSGRSSIDRWKVFTSKASHDHGGQGDKNGRRRVLSRTEIAPPNSIVTESYILLGIFSSKEEAQCCLTYACTRFFRFLVSLRSSTQDITKERFSFVPDQVFSHPWTDEELYAKYGLTDAEIDFIESMIKPMELEPSSEADNA